MRAIALLALALSALLLGCQGPLSAAKIGDLPHSDPTAVTRALAQSLA